MWYAKPSGPYNIGSPEWIGNFNEIYNMLSWTDEAKAGMMGNLQHESGFNPWRWQGDTVNTSAGYGLPQFTPASGYLGLSGVTPNMSTTATTTGATPADGARQMQAVDSDELSKWVSGCWRNYWSPVAFSQLYNYRAQILNTWGNGSSISMALVVSCVTGDTQPLTNYVIGIFGLASIAVGFYYWKAKNENLNKYAKKYLKAGDVGEFSEHIKESLRRLQNEE